MKNYIILLFTFLLTNFQLSAQSLLEGSIVNGNGADITTATIQLHHLADESLSVKMTVEQDGYFIMENIPDGTYWLEVTAADYEPIVITDFNFPKDTDKVMGLNMASKIDLNKVEKIMVKRGKDWPLHVSIH